jgi:predicted MFS family arabinose efflux permease
VDAVPEEVRGQAFGLLSTGLMTGQAIGAALVGVLGEVFSPRLAIVAAGGAAILTALALSRALRPETVPPLEALGKKEREVSRPDAGPTA